MAQIFVVKVQNNGADQLVAEDIESTLVDMFREESPGLTIDVTEVDDD